jgi:hypothetical protein
MMTEPILYTEDEIRAVLNTHYPFADLKYEENGHEVFCGACSGFREPFHYHHENWTVEHLMTALKEHR